MPIKTTDTVHTPRLTCQEFDAVLAAKGWSKKSVAERWGVTPVWVSNLSRNPDRPPHWDDAVLGLPNYRFLARNEKRRRNLVEALTRQACGTIKSTRGFRYHDYLQIGAIVSTAEDINMTVTAGMRGIVFGTRETGKYEEYGVVFESGNIDWFPPLYVDKLLASTGLTDELTANFSALSEEQAADRYSLGQFNFW